MREKKVKLGRGAEWVGKSVCKWGGGGGGEGGG